MKNDNAISVVIPSFNSKKTIEKCLESVLGQDLDRNFEVIVVDSSTDSTPSIIRSRFPVVKLIHLEKKTDPGTARNIGADQAQGNVLAFIDSDCVACEQWLQRIMLRHEEGYRVVGGAVLNGNPEHFLSWASYIIEFSRWFPTGEVRLETHIPSCNISYEKALFLEHNGFSTLYPVEDHLFNYKIVKSNISILFDSYIGVYHYHRDDVVSFIKHQLRRGRAAASIRFEVNQIDSFVGKHTLVAFVVVPFFVIIKGYFNLYRLMKWKMKSLGLLPFYLPAFCLGLCFWGFGFIKEVRFRRLGRAHGEKSERAEA